MLLNIMDPLYIIIPFVIVMVLLLFVYNQYSLLEILLFIFFLSVIAIIGTQYFFGINLTATLQNLFTQPEIDISIVQPDNTKPTTTTDSTTNNVTNLDTKNQTFHVQGQFDYMNAKAVCKAYGGKLANIKQVTDAYEKGAEWCNYGWSDDHMVLFPTQYKTWQSYQELGRKELCGRPGVNGGYNNHLLQQLGANCFGKKPKLNGPMPTQPIPHEIVDKRVEYWQNKLPSLTVSPFNYTAWSQ
jgi:hypothetical protein